MPGGLGNQASDPRCLQHSQLSPRGDMSQDASQHSLARISATDERLEVGVKLEWPPLFGRSVDFAQYPTDRQRKQARRLWQHRVHGDFPTSVREQSWLGFWGGAAF